MIQSGPFDTTTKTKIKTPFGTVLKVVRYEIDMFYPDIEYKIRGKCSYCGENCDCWCFDENEEYNGDSALQAATEALQFGFICDKPKCVIKHEQMCNPEHLKILQANHPDDEYGLRDAIYESWPEMDEGPEECGV